MTRYRNSGRRTKSRRGLTAAQQKSHEAAFAKCDYTIEGRFGKGAVVADYVGRKAWKVTTYGIRYHEDVAACIYGVQECSGPKGWKQSVAIRDAIEEVQTRGTHEPESRGGDAATQQARPAGERLASWTDRRHNSEATCETIAVYEGGIVRVVRPIYDDSPVVMWIKDGKLAKRLVKLITQCPNPVVLPAAQVNRRIKDASN